MPVPAGPTPKVMVELADAVDVALLVDGLGRDAQAAVAPDDVLEHLGGRLVRVQRAGDGADRAGPDLVAARDQVGELAHDALARARLILRALQREQVAAQEDAALQMALQRAQHGVLAARQLGRDIPRQLDLGPHNLCASCLIAERRLDEP